VPFWATASWKKNLLRLGGDGACRRADFRAAE